MSVHKHDLRRRRLKSGGWRAKWLRNPRLLRLIIWLGVLAYRLWHGGMTCPIIVVAKSLSQCVCNRRRSLTTRRRRYAFRRVEIDPRLS
jgi:hypothetical protein